MPMNSTIYLQNLIQMAVQASHPCFSKKRDQDWKLNCLKSWSLNFYISSPMMAKGAGELIKIRVKA